MVAQVQSIINIEQELMLYKNFVSQLPFGFNFIDDNLQLELVKERGVIEPQITCNYDPSLIKYDIKLEEDFEFEMVEEFLSPILDLIPHHITFINNEGNVTLCNEQVLKDYKLKKEDVMGNHISELLSIDNDKIILLETLESGKEIRDREILDKNYGILNTKLIKNNGEVKRVIGTFQFLNAIKDAERKGIAGRIAAGIAHEIRNPLTIVRGFLQVMEVQEDKKALIDTLLIPELDRANSIITDFLAIAKTAPVKDDALKINEYVGNSLQNLFQSELLIHGVKLNLELDDQLDNDIIVVNKDEITQVFLNLLKNSIEASNKNNLNILLKTEDLKDRVRITFADNGPGISPTLVDCIFDPFFTTKDEGTGLGLSVSKKIVENHGGIMKVESCKYGTKFIIELPLM